MPTKTKPTTTAVPAPHLPTYTAADPARWRRRARRERIAYAAAAPLLAVGPTLDAALPLHAAVAATGAGSLMWLYYKARPPRQEAGGRGGRPRRRESERLELETSGRLELLRAAYKSTPVVSGSALYLAALATAPDLAPWWQWGGPAAWAAVMAAALPRTRAPRRQRRDPREMLADLERAAGMRPSGEEEDDDDQADELPAPRNYEELVAWHWEMSGIAAGCHLAHVQQFADDRPDFRAVVIAPHGKAVPQLSPTALAAVWDLPEGTVTLEPAPGHGPGHKVIIARPTLTDTDSADPEGGPAREIDPDLAALYRARLARPGGPLEGVHLLAARADTNRLAWRVRAPGDDVLRLPHKAIARALGIDDEELVTCQTNGMGDGIVSAYETHPLLSIREATVADLTMNERGEIAFGLMPDGRPALINLYKPSLGATNDLFVGAPGSGKSVALNTLLIAERINGIVSLVADAQDGMSLPEANGRTAHFGAGIPTVAATLYAAYAVAKYRQDVSAANRWGSFERDKPWSLAIITLDELNLILAEEVADDIPAEFRKWITGMISKFQITGRKMGMGIRFAAQGIHSSDLGDKTKLRANAKTGNVWIGRTLDGTTKNMATDGVASGVELIPVPEMFGVVDDMDAAFRGEVKPTGPTTAGTANLIRQGSVTRMRVWRAVKDPESRTYTGLIDLYESAPMPDLSPEEREVFDQAYTVGLDRAERMLADEDDDQDDGVIDDGLDALLNPGSSRPAPPATVPDQIRAALHTHGPLPLREIRAALPHLAPGTIGNAITTMTDTGDIIRAGRGVYALPD